ncbi:MAG: glycosyltransferase [Planctomycetes bacterium]|nr:glycosyltransferase [Planctomycetota bacterium]
MEVDFYVSGDLTAGTLRGGEKHALHLAKALLGRGYSIALVCRSAGDGVRHATVEGLDVTALPAAPLPRLRWRLGACATIAPLARQLRRHTRRPDAVLAFSPWLALAARRARGDVPVVHIVTDLLAASEAFERAGAFAFPKGSWLCLGLNAFVERRAYRRAACSVVSSRWMADGLAASGVLPDRLRMAYPGPATGARVDTMSCQEARRALGLPPDRLIVLGVGALTVRKNARLLADAMGRTVADVRAVFVGDGPGRETLQRFCDQRGLADRVRFAGWVEDVRPWYAAGDVLCHTAPYETYGLVYAEAMAAGLAILGPRHAPPTVYSTAGELIEDGREGLLYDATDAGALAAALDRLADDPAVLAGMKLAARRRSARFTWDRYADVVIEALAAV